MFKGYSLNSIAPVICFRKSTNLNLLSSVYDFKATSLNRYKNKHKLLDIKFFSFAFVF